MSNTMHRTVTLVLCAGLLALQVSPAWAQFTGAGTQATNWLVQLITPLIPIGCIVVAVTCMIGRINWMWFGAALLGTALFFGRDQVISMFRSWTGT
jgi:type IV secretory pathway VirB2 component (pilin)